MRRMRNAVRGLFGAAVLVVLALGAARADQVGLNVALGQPVLQAGGARTTYLKVGLTGFPLERPEDRPPVNVAIVLDKSGSMQGEKIQKAREAAVEAIRRLTPADIVSVIAYDDTVQVVVPATKLSDPDAVIRAIRGIQADGSTALFAGVGKGAAEVRKFLEADRVNRIVLLSDGLANVGPQSPEELGELGASLRREGMSVTTLGLGLGYNEDLMARLAATSDGNHAFIESADELADIFGKEFGIGLAVVAKEVQIAIECAEGVRPLRILGREGEIDGGSVLVPIAQIYSRQERYVLVEVEVAAGIADQTRAVANVEVTYANLQTRTTDRLQSRLAVRYTAEEDRVLSATNREVMVAAARQIANDQSRLALALRDQGKVEEAQQLLERNYHYLEKEADRYASPKLREDAKRNWKDAETITDEGRYREQRKRMVDEQLDLEAQPAY
ncbi:MAG: vWA domain-containing protein [Planctomycetota bacterium]